MARLVRRLLAAAAMAGVLQGCGLVVSQKPVFPEKMAAADPALEGLYTLRGPSTGSVAVVTRTDTRYSAAFYRTNTGPNSSTRPYRQSGAADFQLVAIGDGDYAVQASCVIADTGAGFFGSAQDGPQYQYAVLMAARAHQNFWLGIFPGSLFELKYQIPTVRQSDTYDISGIDADKALALFRDWRDGLLEAGGEFTTPIVRTADELLLTPAPNDPNPSSCRRLLDAARRPMKTDAK